MRRTLPQSIRRLAGRFARHRGGSVAMIFAITSPMLIGAAGFGVETTYWYNEQLRLQQATDAAAYAAGIERRGGASQDQMVAAATRAAADNGVDVANATITVQTPAYNQVRVTVGRTAERFFTAFFQSGRVPINAAATASFSSSASACILALNPTAPAAANFAGSTDVNLINCSVMANSVADDAVKMQGAALLRADCLISVGGAVLTSGGTLTVCPAPITQAPPAGDPYANVTQPSAPANCENGSGATLVPGRYCGGLSLSGDVTLSPGVYYISGGTFRINSGANVHGDNVTIFLAAGSRASFNGHATINLAAPTTGAYAGLLMWGDRSSTGGSRNSFNGTADSHLTGSLYFPTQGLDFLGDFSGVQNCMQIVADTVAWSGNSSMTDDCSHYGIREAPTVSLVRVSA